MKSYLVLLLLFILGSSCNTTIPNDYPDPDNFRTTGNEGLNTDLYILKNKNRMEAYLSNFGARVVSIYFPDKSGNPIDVTLGFDNIFDYMNINCNFGATIGRYANRIGYARFNLDGDNIQVSANNGPHCLHGGFHGWQTKVFEAKEITDTSIVFSYTSSDGEEGFPGTVSAEIKYTITNNNELLISYYATTDKATVINLTNHTFFNLSGNPENSAIDHILYINASSFIPVNASMIPKGDIKSVSGTPMDFKSPAMISAVMDTTYCQIKYAGGYDHCWILDTDKDMKTKAASLYSATSGIKLDVFTDEPGIQIFTGNAFNGSFKGRNGIEYRNRPSVCFETQHFPDSPNNPDWPSTILRPGEIYTSHCIYKFSVPDIPGK